MIHTWRLKNFKSIKGSMEQLELSDLNVFAGINSSGKSTLIQSILLVSQSLLGPNEEIPLMLNGDLVSLGSFEDVWNNGDISQPLEIEFIVSSPEFDNARAYYNLTFEAATNNSQLSTVNIKNALLGWAEERYPDDFSELEITRQGDDLIITYASEETEEEIQRELTNRALTLDNAKIRLKYFIPDGIAVRGRKSVDDFTWVDLFTDPLSEKSEDYLSVDKDQIPDNIYTILIKTIENLGLPHIPSNPIRFLRNKNKTFFERYREWFKRLKTDDSDKLRKLLANDRSGTTIEYTDWFNPNALSKLGQLVENYFKTKVRYLSANRIPPTLLFKLTPPIEWAEVGIDGHNVASALNEYGTHTITYWDPTQKKIAEQSLLEATLTWMQHLGLVDSLSTKSENKLGISLYLTTEGVTRPLDLTSVGFGTSQVLPIIVQGLLTPAGGTFIVEQPEVHLHPKLQSKLAYFFYALTKANVQCIVETHSDHIINQLRVLVAEEDIRKHIRIYFAQRDIASGTKFEKVVLGRNGNIQNWPADFLSEGSKLTRELLNAARTASES